MGAKKLGDLLVTGAIVVILDWFLGVMCAWGIFPLWVFFIFNIPFGAGYVWMESSWNGNHYRMLGLNITEFGSLIVFLIVVAAQSLFYFALYEWLRSCAGKKRPRRLATKRT
jgi:hypothetical protein